ncbi:hypothetical protein P3X46_035288 [Hevea brasiliensis]|uniref:Tr-type G domain-containing protein n=1 Tax=Hevea brasiliensis TaxID=3981 RepID=A0ABQ9KAI7_HEVBR|nr:hypothetical protein P3X46_035288 [Hevea brasiliensis]
MDHNLYDEFGNYNGPEIESEQESDGEEEDEQLPDKPHENEEASDGKEAIDASNGWVTTANDVDMDNQIVLAEDKKYYPTAEEVYGEDVDTLVMDEDEQPLEQPIIKSVRNIKPEVGVKDSSTYLSSQFLVGLMSNPSLTLFMDMLVEQTRHMLTFNTNCEKHMRYTDTRIDEQQRRISIKAVPMSPVLEDSNSKSYLCDIMDIPGHVNFSDEMTAGFADGAVLIVDAAEGVMLLPKDAYHKLGHTIEVINNHITAVSSTAGNVQVLNPGNVCLQVLREDGPLLCNHLLNYVYYHPDMMAFKKKPSASGGEISFVQFVLEPPYTKLGVILPKAAYKLNFQSLLRLGCSSVFGSASGFTDMLVQPIPSAKNAAAKKVDHIYLGPNDSMIYKAMVNLTKLWVYQARYRLHISMAPPGSWVLIKGMDASIRKTATLCNPLQFNTLPVVKTATEPLTPRIYLDSVMKDLRELYSEVEVKVADPVVSFSEIVVESSSMKCFDGTPNKKNKVTMIQTPIDCLSAIYIVLSPRCGHVTADIPRAAFCLSVLDHWAVVRGDKIIVLQPLEPSGSMLEMSEDMSANKFFDEAMVVELAQQAADIHQQMILGSYMVAKAMECSLLKGVAGSFILISFYPT